LNYKNRQLLSSITPKKVSKWGFLVGKGGKQTYAFKTGGNESFENQGDRPSILTIRIVIVLNTESINLHKRACLN
jgi:hypothetical protein